MATKAIKISEENYEWLAELAGEIQIETGEPISLDKALSYVRRQRGLSNLAGKSKMTNKEVKKLFKDLDKGWKKWNKRYA